ncbi:nickel pincer cofactor biosynthesis protein LarC [Nocardioides litoris]|uniref:nickel pincer cofactor biosynthesis protein LarC n=1 Tax=Nocardioides litoris TaxID=1926648 RepID=UPI001FE50154|nr:nickel pincer cofactor biosynthesis protein LarC [Nocardioides litoris]
MPGPLGWLDASSGVSGDMLLGACVGAGVPLAVPQAAIDALDLPERVVLSSAEVTRSAISATKVDVTTGESHHHRRLADVLALLSRLEPVVGSVAGSVAAEVFRVLAEAEARVHRVGVADVHFHEVGALDAIADVVGVVACVQHLGLDRLVCSPVALGGGRARTEHGSIPVPAPAVLELLSARGMPSYGGPLERELATPTGVALLAVLVDGFGPMPAMVPSVVGVGAGSSDPEGHANVLRLVVGSSVPGEGAEPALVLEANVDDLDPRLWPGVLAALMAAGADDAWLVPIQMKKGRPAHTVSVLCAPARVDDLVRVLVTHTSTIGLRRRPVDKLPLPREDALVSVDGQRIRVKVARLDGRVVNVNPEHDDVVAAAAALGRPEKVVLAAALHAAHGLWGG